MANRGLVPQNNQQPDVQNLLTQGRSSLRALARAYFVTEVAGQSPATIDAKRRDLVRFFTFYLKLYGHDRPEEWYASVTREFVRQTARAGIAEATLARTCILRELRFRGARDGLGSSASGRLVSRQKPPQRRPTSKARRGPRLRIGLRYES